MSNNILLVIGNFRLKNKIDKIKKQKQLSQEDDQ